MGSTANGRSTFLGWVVGGVVVVCAAQPVFATEPVLSDELYQAHHPRLLFTNSQLPVLFDKVRDGGRDDDAYAFIKSQFDNVYQTITFDSLLETDMGLEELPNIAMAMNLEGVVDTAAAALGKAVTLYIARTYDVDYDPFYSSLRLRALAIGYDNFFGDATMAERDSVRNEANAYMDRMTNNFSYHLWLYSPYTSNKTAMVAASLGLAAICFNDETDPTRAANALAMADNYAAAWMDAQLEQDGCCREGTLYGAWSFRNLIYYFHARRLFDTYDYAGVTRIRNFERWLAFELDPRGSGAVNNIHDCTDYYTPLARHTTYLDWAQSQWGSGLSAYIWEHTVGTYGDDLGDHADKVGTLLWHRDDVAPVNPETVLPRSYVWASSGLYYYRSGWPDGNSADDFVFSFYSGQFRGGHAQEDQNQFTMTAYRNKLVSDNGAGNPARQSEAHSMILIDGAGQHNAGASIGTDGQITEYVLGSFADYILGDATEAYTTHSPFNDPDVPFPGIDWSWGYSGANPVLQAKRRVAVVHPASAMPYALIFDDIDKDANPHNYVWCLHTDETNAVVAGSNPVHVTGSTAEMDLYALGGTPVTSAVAPFNNGGADPNSKLISLSATAVNPYFTVLLVPRPAGGPVPLVVDTPTATGSVTSIIWPDGNIDVILTDRQPGTIASAVARFDNTTPAGRTAASSPASLETDASIAIVRLQGTTVVGYLMDSGTLLSYNSIDYVTMNDGPAGVSFEGDAISINRENADFVFYAGTATGVWYRNSPQPSINTGGYLTPAALTSADGTPSQGGLTLRTYPNPFNPSVSVELELPAAGELHVEVFDVRGARVRTLWSGQAASGASRFNWNGRNDDGIPLASGVYLIRATSGAWQATTKIVLVE